VDCFKANWSFAYNVTNDTFFKWDPFDIPIINPFMSAVGMATASQTATQSGLVSVGMAVSDTYKSYKNFANPIYGVANLGVRGTAIAIAANGVVNLVTIVVPGIKGGLAVGATISAAYSTGFGWCGAGAR
jgi:hypothetical protein